MDRIPAWGFLQLLATGKLFIPFPFSLKNSFPGRLPEFPCFLTRDPLLLQSKRHFFIFFSFFLSSATYAIRDAFITLSNTRINRKYQGQRNGFVSRAISRSVEWTSNEIRMTGSVAYTRATYRGTITHYGRIISQ